MSSAIILSRHSVVYLNLSWFSSRKILVPWHDRHMLKPVLDWCIGLVHWTGVLDWCTGLVHWTGALDWCIGYVVGAKTIMVILPLAFLLSNAINPGGEYSSRGVDITNNSDFMRQP